MTESTRLSHLADEMDQAEELECCQHCQDNILEWLVQRGYHLAREGEAVYKGRVYQLQWYGENLIGLRGA